MRVNKTALALAGACGLALCAAGPARADVVYSYDGLPTYQSFSPGYTAPPLLITLDITDAAVQSGSFQLSGYGGAPTSDPSIHDAPAYTGDAADLISFSASGLATATPTTFPLYNTFNIAFTFDAAGDITSDRVQFLGPSDDGLVTGNEALTSGSVGSDGPWCNSDYTSGLCTVSGSWTHTAFASPVPEPASLALFAAGLLGLGTLRRRRGA